MSPSSAPLTEAGERLLHDLTSPPTGRNGSLVDRILAIEAEASAGARALAGHRFEGEHDCFLANCKDVGRELERLRAESWDRQGSLAVATLMQAFVNVMPEAEFYPAALIREDGQKVAAEYARLSGQTGEMTTDEWRRAYFVALDIAQKRINELEADASTGDRQGSLDPENDDPIEGTVHLVRALRQHVEDPRSETPGTTLGQVRALADYVEERLGDRQGSTLDLRDALIGLYDAVKAYTDGDRFDEPEVAATFDGPMRAALDALNPDLAAARAALSGQGS